MTYREKLQNWYAERCGSSGIHFSSGTDPEPLIEDVAREAYEVLAGIRESIDDQEFDDMIVQAREALTHMGRLRPGKLQHEGQRSYVAASGDHQTASKAPQVCVTTEESDDH